MTTAEQTGVAHVPTIRNAGFDDMFKMLQEQQSQKVDGTFPAKDIKFVGGQLVIAGAPVGDPTMDEEGVTPGVDPNGTYWPTQGFDDQLAERLDIAPAYLRRLRHGRINKAEKLMSPARLDLWDANVNGLLAGRKAKVAIRSVDGVHSERVTIREELPADSRSFFLRLLRNEDGTGIARAVLSNRFARMDHLDGLMAMLEGINKAGVDRDTLRIYGDLSETRMFVHVAAPEILAAAPGLLEGYRSPFESESENVKRKGHVLSFDERVRLGAEFRERGHGDGNHSGFYEPGNEPLVHAGFLLSNSEIGSGRWTIMPEITVLRCSNGLTMTKDGFARNHVGARMDDGMLEWSEDTQGKELALVTAQTRDVVKAVLSPQYLEDKIAELEEKAGRVIAEPEKTIEIIAKKLAFSKADQEGILRHFFLGGQLTSGGVMNAVTSYSQTVPNSDTAHDLNNRAIEAMELAYAGK